MLVPLEHHPYDIGDLVLCLVDGRMQVMVVIAQEDDSNDYLALRVIDESEHRAYVRVVSEDRVYRGKRVGVKVSHLRGPQLPSLDTGVIVSDQIVPAPLMWWLSMNEAPLQLLERHASV
jgi:hypothetical protein